MNMPLVTANGLWFLIFPILLLAYYAVCWVKFGNHEKIRAVAPQYDPPAGISPGVARYILTGGSDGTSLAAILAQLASTGIIAIEPEAGSYRVKLLKKNDPVMADEAALIQSLLHVSLPVLPYALNKSARSFSVVQARNIELRKAGLNIDDWSPQPLEMATINSKAQPQVASLLNDIQRAFRENLEGVYFRWHWGCAGVGFLGTFVWAMVNAVLMQSGRAPSVFLTVWLFFFSSIAGLVFSGVITSRPARPTPGQRLQVLLIPLFFFVLPGFLIAHVFAAGTQMFVLALLLTVMLNSTFLVLLRAPTAEGRRVLESLAGFREFLVRVEQDRLDRVNTPQQKAELMDKFLPYAIALGVKEGWGDTMASAFSNAIVER